MRFLYKKTSLISKITKNSAKIFHKTEKYDNAPSFFEAALQPRFFCYDEILKHFICKNS